MIKSERPYLILIREALDRIETYKPATFEEYESDSLRQDAIAMRLQEIGENLAHIRDITPTYYSSHASETWPQIIGLRNLLSHGYHTVKPEQIWDILLNHLPLLSYKIDILLGEKSG